MREMLKEKVTAMLINGGWDRAFVESVIDEWVDRLLVDEAEALAKYSAA